MSILALLAISVFQLCNSFPSPRQRFEANLLKFNPSTVRQDGPLGMEELNMLHADAVKFGAGADNTWFTAIDAKTLDSLITEMNEMNRWFAKVVKYWDDFTSGGDGKAVLEQNGKGIKKLPQDKGGSDDGEGPNAAVDPALGGDEEDAGGEEGGDDGAGDDGAAADNAGADGTGMEDADDGTDGDEALTDPDGEQTEGTDGEGAEDPGADGAGADGAGTDGTGMEDADGDEAPTDPDGEQTEGTEDGGADTEVTDDEAANNTEGGDDAEPGVPDENGDGEGLSETDGAEDGEAETDGAEEGAGEDAKPAAKPAKPASARGLFGGKRKEARRKRRM